jgi:Cu/Ag efflux pump CusA
VEGEYEARQESDRRLTLWGIVAAIGIFLLLVASFRSARLALLSFVTLPMALVGGVLGAHFFGNNTISLGSLVGFLTLLNLFVVPSLYLELGRRRRGRTAAAGSSRGPAT